MFVPDGADAVVATILTQGPWDANAQYGGTPAALLVWAVERVPTLVPMRIARFTIDMHRPVPLGRLTIETEVVREGKRLQIVLAIIRDPGGVEVARAHCAALPSRPGSARRGHRPAPGAGRDPVVRTGPACLTVIPPG